jgi:hypothetical protein
MKSKNFLKLTILIDLAEFIEVTPVLALPILTWPREHTTFHERAILMEWLYRRALSFPFYSMAITCSDERCIVRPDILECCLCLY